MGQRRLGGAGDHDRYGAPGDDIAIFSVAANSPATAIGIAAPTDADFREPSALVVTITGLPTDGTVMLADGVTPPTQGETLTAAQLANLQFLPTPNVFSTNSTFTYGATDPAGNSASGSANPAIEDQSVSVPAELTGDEAFPIC